MHHIYFHSLISSITQNNNMAASRCCSRSWAMWLAARSLVTSWLNRGHICEYDVGVGLDTWMTGRWWSALRFFNLVLGFLSQEFIVRDVTEIRVWSLPGRRSLIVTRLSVYFGLGYTVAARGYLPPGANVCVAAPPPPPPYKIDTVMFASSVGFSTELRFLL